MRESAAYEIPGDVEGQECDGGDRFGKLRRDWAGVEVQGYLSSDKWMTAVVCLKFPHRATIMSTNTIFQQRRTTDSRLLCDGCVRGISRTSLVHHCSYLNT